MSTELAKLPTAEAIEKVLIAGDLSVLSEPQRLAYYKSVCASVGLNPLTQPLQYIRLNGKLVLYAAKGCTDQLRQIYGVSVTDLTTASVHGVYVVSVKVANKEGRTDMATGAVALDGLKGEALANALMKTETKAKRRATLSICGLSLLDETEVETIPGAQKMAPQEAKAFVDSTMAALKNHTALPPKNDPPISLTEPPPEPPDYVPYEEAENEARFTFAYAEKKTGRNGEYRKVFWREGAAGSCFFSEEFATIDSLKAGDVVTAEIKRKGDYINIVRITSVGGSKPEPQFDDSALFVGEDEGARV